MRQPKNNFYRKLKLSKEVRGAIQFFNQIKYYMLRDLDLKKKKTEKK